MKNKFILCLLTVFTFALSTAQTTTPKDKETVVLETLGSLSGLLVYNTYLTIGAVADGYASEAYTAAAVVELMNEQINSCKTVNAQYQALLDSGFLTDPADREYVKELKNAFSLLSNQAYYLKQYVNDKSETSSNEYQSYRGKAWNVITQLLGME